MFFFSSLNFSPILLRFLSQTLLVEHTVVLMIVVNANTFPLPVVVRHGSVIVQVRGAMAHEATQPVRCEAAGADDEWCTL
jgi:hypothetical protein